MNELLRCRAMESMCRQRASFYPNEAWKFLAEAEMWQHRALDLVASDEATSGVLATNVVARNVTSPGLVPSAAARPAATDHRRAFQ